MYDNIAHVATINSYCNRTRFPHDVRVEPIAIRLKLLRESAEPKLTIRGLATALDMHPSTYAAYEDVKKFKKPILPLDLAKRIGDVLGRRGVDTRDVMHLAGITGGFSQLIAKERISVIGAVAAGIWREQTFWSEDDVYDIEVSPSPLLGERFAVRMDGYSMDRTIPPGSELECLRVPFGNYQPKAGQLVIVERLAHDLTELTCKRLVRNADGQWLLRCESTKPEFQGDILIGSPELGAAFDDETRVLGIVMRSHQDHLRFIN